MNKNKNMKLVDLPTAKSLQEFGYDGEFSHCHVYVGCEAANQIMTLNDYEKCRSGTATLCAAPRLDDAAYWLRDKHRLNIEILVTANGKWIWQISSTANGESVFPRGYDLPLDVCETYADALEHAVLKAIEIIKNKTND